MSMEERIVPELRFKGFHDNWEQRKLNQELSLLKDGTHGTHKNVTNGLYLLSAKNIKNGEIIITEQDRQISREEFNKIHRNFVLHSGDVLLTVVGSIGETAILTKPKDVTFQRSVAYLRPSQMNSQFLYNLIQTVGFQNELKKKQVVSAQPGVYLGDLKKISIKMTKNATEQIKISQFTQLIDKIITLHQRKIQILDNMYSLLIREIYPKKHEVVPKIRFSEYSSHWIKITLESLLKEFSIKSSIENEYQILSSTNSGMEFRRGRVSGSSNRGYKIIDNGDLVLSPQNLWLGNININKLGKGLVSPSYKTFSIDKVDGEFLEPQLRTKRMLNTFENVSTQGASVVRRNLDMDLFKQIIVKVPTNQEKEKIANLLNLIMNLIKHYDSKLMKLQTIKTEYLKKMFL